MLGPNDTTRHLATKAYDERLAHSARIRMAAQDTHDVGRPDGREAHRHMTVARLSASIGSALHGLLPRTHAVANR